MNRTLSRMAIVLLSSTAMLVLLAGSLAANVADDPKQPVAKDRPLTLDARFEKLKAGILKLKEDEVVALLGASYSAQRPAKQASQPGTDWEAQWEYATRISVNYKDGKVSDVTGTFSADLPIERVSPQNFRRILDGMTEQEVIAILGDQYAIMTMGTTVGHQWGGQTQIKVGFRKDGRMIQYQRSGYTYEPQKKP